MVLKFNPYLGYDKIKLFGFPIHAAVDGFSRKVLWLEVCRSNNSSLLTRTDYGTENGHIAAIQSYFQADEEAHKYETSTRNQRIKNWWSHFRKSCASWLINFFKDLQDRETVESKMKILM